MCSILPHSAILLLAAARTRVKVNQTMYNRNSSFLSNIPVDHRLFRFKRCVDKLIIRIFTCGNSEQDTVPFGQLEMNKFLYILAGTNTYSRNLIFHGKKSNILSNLGPTRRLFRFKLCWKRYKMSCCE